jgi:uncharacterized membrane protein YeaQ/YmgE (transglycosylase-associated protein family)
MASVVALAPDSLNVQLMALLPYLIVLILVGLIAGALARLVLPGPDPMTILETLGLGLAGNLLAGLIVWAISGRGLPGIILSVVCSTAILYVIRRTRGGTLTRPAEPPR